MGWYSIEKTPSDYLMLLAAKHKALRKQAGYTQAEMAERSGVSIGSIKRFEASGQISLESLLKLLQLLNRLQDLDTLMNLQPNLKAIEKLFKK